MSNAEMLHRWSQSEWPTDDFTVAQNLADLQRHEREHNETRQAALFAAAGLEQRLASTLPDGRPCCVFG